MQMRMTLLCGGASMILLLGGCTTTAPTTTAVAPPPTTQQAPTPPPDSEVFLADLDLATATIAAPRNITQREGYDNQPSFLADGSAVLFVSDRSGSTDVYRFDIASGKTRQVTATKESEFSPTPLDDGSGFSAIHVERPEAKGEEYTESQQLWRYDFDGKPAARLLETRRVGYHAWIDQGHVALFLVGNDEAKKPHTLVLADLATGETTLLSKAPGRKLDRTPDGSRVSFVDKSDPKRWVVAAVAPGNERPQELVETPAGPEGEKEPDRSEDYCWLPDGSLLMAKGSRFLRWDGKTGTGFALFSDVGDLGGDIKRLAVSGDGTRLAFVVQMRPKTEM